jgi:hypothetical protein
MARHTQDDEEYGITEYLAKDRVAKKDGIII